MPAREPVDTVVRYKLLLATVLALAVGLFIALDLGRHFQLAALQQALDHLQQLQAQRPALFVVVYVLLFVALFGLALPVGTVMTLAGGALFGFWPGVLLVSFASTWGITLAFLLSRYLFGDLVRARLGPQLAAIDEGLRSEGGFYLFSLRLVPIFPPALLSVLFGVTRMPLRRFYIASQLGMLSGTVIYVYAGTQLATLRSVRDILSPAVLAALLLLAVFPLLARKAVTVVRARRLRPR